MSKTGRNDPCPCGSGDKYKRCCLQRDQAAESATLAAAKAAQEAEQAARQAQQDALRQSMTEELDELQALATASNDVIEMIHAGRLDEAEAAARELLVRFPEAHDGYDRLGMVYEARGQHKHAADCYRQVIEFVRARPDQYEPEFESTFRRLIAKLDPLAPG